MVVRAPGGSAAWSRAGRYFLKNVAVAGGLLQIVAFGAGRFSLDGRLPKRAPFAPIYCFLRRFLDSTTVSNSS
jgi:hypothetical protein